MGFAPRCCRLAAIAAASCLIAAQGVGVADGSGSASWKEWSVLWEYHTDISIGYDASSDGWSLKIDRGEFGLPGVLLSPESTLLLATPESIRTKPDGVPSSFDFLGEPGDTYYLLPFSEPAANSKILYLGSNADHLPSGVFEGNRVHWRLADFAGPGDFFLYQVHGGTPFIYMDSRAPSPPYGPGFDVEFGGHFHFNWVFREPGIYLLSFEAAGTLLSGEATSSEKVPFFFLVDPKPSEWWLVDQFRERAHSPGGQLSGDVSGDGYSNLLAYAFDYSPHGPAAGFLPEPEVVQREGQSYLSLVFRQPGGEPGRDDRTDLVYRVQASHDLLTWSDITDSGLTEAAGADEDGTPRVRVLDTEPLGFAARRFLRLVVEHQP